MDDPTLDAVEHRRALAGLARINRFSSSVGVLWPAVVEVARRLDRAVRILDIATGSGDVPIRLWQRSQRHALKLDILGTDVSPTAVLTAFDRAKPIGPVEFETLDVFQDDWPADFDIVMCSLFMHHLSEPDAVELLRRMAAAGRRVIVNDLERSRLNLGLVWLATRLLSRSPVVHFDGPASVRSAFTASELHDLATQAGLTGARVVRRFPCRLLLVWDRS